MINAADTAIEFYKYFLDIRRNIRKQFLMIIYAQSIGLILKVSLSSQTSINFINNSQKISNI